MINIKDLTLALGEKVIFSDVNFTIDKNDKIGLVGRNGSGKTTLFKILTNEYSYDEGSITFPYGYKIGYLKQHISFTNDTVIGEVVSVLDEDRGHEDWKAEKILEGLGFSEDDMLKSPNQFSGGFQVKINLAKLLLSEPNMLLLDEPTNYLDIHSIIWLGKFLKKWQGELIIITHNKGFMDEVITHSLIIHRRNVRKIKGKPHKIKEQIAIEEEIYEQTRLAEEKRRSEIEDWAKKFGAKASKASVVKSKLKLLEKQEVREKLETVEDIFFKFNYHDGTKKDLLEVSDLSFGYTDDLMLIKNLNLSVQKDDKICIIGKNGYGKSTLLKVLLDVLSPKNGSVVKNPHLKYSYFSQMNKNELDDNNTILAELTKCFPNHDIGSIRRVCSSMLFSRDAVNKKIGVLSGGEKSRIMLAKIVLDSANLICLDEPTNHLDAESCEVLMEAVQEFEGAVLLVTHDEYFLKKIATKLIIFDDNSTFFFNGNYDDFLRKVGWKEKSLNQKQK
jgi:ATP-binding cassette subfamily F protein 3